MSNAFAAWVEVLPDFSQFNRKAPTEMSRILGAAGAAGGAAASTNIGSSILGGIRGLAGPVVGAVAALGIGKLIGDAIGTGIRYTLDSVGLASDLSETKSAIQQVFGPASADIQTFAESANSALGQTRIEALRGAQTFGVFGKAAGLTDKPLADFSTGLVTLSTDLASFFNTSPAEAIDAIGAGLRGESEPLRRYGVLLDDAALKNRAMVLGIYDGTGALSQQQRVLAAHAEIFAQTAIAQGDFARTSGGLANQQRQFNAQLEDIQTRLGEALLPPATELLTFVNANVLPSLTEAMGEAGPRLAASLEAKLPELQKIISGIADTLPGAIDLALGLASFAVDVNVNLINAGEQFAQSDWFKFWQDLGYNAAEAFKTSNGSAMKANVEDSMTGVIGEFQRTQDQIDPFLSTMNQKVSDNELGMFDAGQTMMRGLQRGIEEQKPYLIAAGAAAASETSARIRQILGSAAVTPVPPPSLAKPSTPTPQVGASGGGLGSAQRTSSVTVNTSDPHVALALVEQRLAGRMSVG